jgi:hypothetical protein
LVFIGLELLEDFPFFQAHDAASPAGLAQQHVCQLNCPANNTSPSKVCGLHTHVVGELVPFAVSDSAHSLPQN